MERLVSIPPKYDGVDPNAPFQRFTWNGNQPRPSTAIAPFGPKAIAGSLSPDEFATGDAVSPGGGDHVPRRTVFEKADADAPAAIAQLAANASANATRNLLVMRIPLPFSAVGANIEVSYNRLNYLCQRLTRERPLDEVRRESADTESADSCTGGTPVAGSSRRTSRNAWIAAEWKRSAASIDKCVAI
jgi:hypothetical protein